MSIRLPHILLCAAMLWHCYTGNGQGSTAADSLIGLLQSKLPDSVAIRLNLEVASQLVFTKPDSSLVYADRAGKLAADGRDRLAEARAWNFWGIVSYNKGQYLSALEYYQKAYEISHSAHDPRGLARAANNIGIIYSAIGEDNKAIGLYREAFEQNVALKLYHQAASNLYNIASAYVTLKGFDGAKNAVQELEKFQAIHGQFVECSSVKAEIFLAGHQLDSALAHIEAAEKYFLEAGNDDYSLADAYLRKADILQTKKSLFESEVSFRKALEIIRRGGFSELELPAVEIESKLLFAQGLYAQAYQAKVRYVGMKDSLDRINSTRRISELNARYEAGKRENMIMQEKQEKRTLTLVGTVVFTGLVILIILILFNLRKNRKMTLLLQTQNSEINSQRQKIISSINYAKRIQDSILASETEFRQFLPESFIYFRPRDIVSGDFYWLKILDGKVFLATLDCTGHGVPGAFMSLIANNKLNNVLSETGLRDPGEILTALNTEVSLLFSTRPGERTNDGMDVSLCVIDTLSKTIQYAGACNSMVLVRDGQLTEFKADPYSIGIGSAAFGGSRSVCFTTQEIPYTPGTCLFMYTDGYSDQFGGPDQKKFNKARFRHLLVELEQKKLHQAQKICEETLQSWKQNEHQLDDILLLGARL